MSIGRFQEKIDECNTRIAGLEIQMERAGVAEKGNYQNQIDNEKSNLAYYRRELEKLQKAKTPDQIQIFFYVLVSTKNRVKQNIGDTNFELFENERYHDSELNQWKPYHQKPAIDTLLSCVKTQYGVEPIYLDGDIDAKHWVNFDDHLDDSVAIIDLFSLDDFNKRIANKFDSAKAGVIIPVCRSLHTNLCAIAESLSCNFNVLKAKTTKLIPCNLYAADISGEERFQQDLIRIFKSKFPIINRSTSTNDVRDLNLNLS